MREKDSALRGKKRSPYTFQTSYSNLHYALPFEYIYIHPEANWEKKINLWPAAANELQSGPGFYLVFSIWCEFSQTVRHRM